MAYVALIVVVDVGVYGAPVSVGQNARDRAGRQRAFEVRTLDGSENNRAHERWGRAGTNYRRLAPAQYADGVASIVDGPSPRYVSNRVFNDIGQNVFSENAISQWGWAWGQFLDHDMGLRDETPAEPAAIPFVADDPLEAFTNDLGELAFARTPAAPNTGIDSPRQQVNTLSSYLDGSGVYGVDSSRLEWLRDGPVDGSLANNSASLLLPDGYLPTVADRGDASAAPPVDLMGRLHGTPDRARVAGDVRANENIALTSIHTMFAREHNRIVASLPRSLSAERKFQIARRIVGAEVEYITYTEFLPSLGIQLPPYAGYRRTVNAGLANEFAAVGYRAHSMIHGQFDIAFDTGRYSAAQLNAFRADGIGVGDEAGASALNVPLTVSFGNPDLLPAIGLGPVLQSLSAERQYRNDEQIDNSLRSVLFKIPKPGTTDPSACQQPVIDPACFSGVEDLGAVDIQRSRDHGIASYNDLRRAYGLEPAPTFAAITGEAIDEFPADAAIDPAKPVDDPHSLDFVKLLDRDGNVVDPTSDANLEQVVTATRRTPLAARLRAIYGDVGTVDAFVGMVSEAHVPGTEFGELQLAIWTKQFTSLRDGDRFFYANDRTLPELERLYGVAYQHTLADLIQLNSDATVPANVFVVG